MVSRSQITVAAAVTLAALLGYAVPRPEGLLRTAAESAPAAAAECPRPETAEVARLQRQVDALEKDLALRDARLKADGDVKKNAPAAEPASVAVAAAKKSGWGRNNADAQREAWAVPAENFQPW